MTDATTPVALDFPVRGEWRAVNTPAERVPSHGTDAYGQRYAIDLVQMDEAGTFYYPGGGGAALRHLTVGLPASRFYCWDQAVHSVFDGRVVLVQHSVADRTWVTWLGELIRTSFVAPAIDLMTGFAALAGNYVVIEGVAGFAVYAHMRRGTVAARLGQQVHAGDVLGAVGNSGNTTMPHLHFHLMDGPDPGTARGLPFAFRNYERWDGRGWTPVAEGVPGVFERVRTVARE